MKDKLYDNADSFATSFDEEWEKIECEDSKIKIDQVINILSNHPFVISNRKIAKEIAKFRVFSLKNCR